MVGLFELLDKHAMLCTLRPSVCFSCLFRNHCLEDPLMGSTNPETVALERIILEEDPSPLVNRTHRLLTYGPRGLPPITHQRTRVAPGATRSGVAAEAYHAYRIGLASACADIVLVGERGGKPCVPLIRRARPPFGDCWWIMGGVVFNFRPIQQLLLWKAHTECGLTSAPISEFVYANALSDTAYSCGNILIVGCLGVYRTPAEDTTDPTKVCDTVNLCYMGIIQGDQEIRYDKDHTNCRWMSAEDLTAGSCGYWYPEHVARRALDVYACGKSGG